MDDTSWDDAINDILNSDDEMAPLKKANVGSTKDALNVEPPKSGNFLPAEKLTHIQETKIEIQNTTRSEISTKPSTTVSPAFSFAPSPTPSDLPLSSTPKNMKPPPSDSQAISASLFSNSNTNANSVEEIPFSLFASNATRSSLSSSPTNTLTKEDGTPKSKKPTSQNNVSFLNSSNEKNNRISSSPPLLPDETILPDFLREDSSGRRRRPQTTGLNIPTKNSIPEKPSSSPPTIGTASTKLSINPPVLDFLPKQDVKDPLAGLLKPMPQFSSKANAINSSAQQSTTSKSNSNLRSEDQSLKTSSENDLTSNFEKLTFTLKDFHQQVMDSIDKLAPKRLDQSIQQLQDISQHLNQMNEIEPKFSSTFLQMQKVLDQFLSISTSINHHADQLHQCFTRLHEENQQCLTNKANLETSRAQFKFEQQLYQHQKLQWEKMQEMYQEQWKEQQLAFDTRVAHFEQDKRQWQTQCQSDREQQKKVQLQLDILQQEYQSRMSELHMDQVQFERQKSQFQAMMTKEMNRLQQKAEKIGLEQVEVQLAQHHVDAQREKLKREREGLEKWVKGLKEVEYGIGTGNSLEWDLLVKEKEKVEKEKSLLERDQMWMTAMCLNQMGYELPRFNGNNKNALNFTNNFDTDLYNTAEWNQKISSYSSPKSEASPGLNPIRKNYFTLR